MPVGFFAVHCLILAFFMRMQVLVRRRDNHAAAWFQHSENFAQHAPIVFEMFDHFDKERDIHGTIGKLRQAVPQVMLEKFGVEPHIRMRGACLPGIFAGVSDFPFANIEADDAKSIQREGQRFNARPASDVNQRAARAFREKFVHDIPELGFARAFDPPAEFSQPRRRNHVP